MNKESYDKYNTQKNLPLLYKSSILEIDKCVKKWIFKQTCCGWPNVFAVPRPVPNPPKPVVAGLGPNVEPKLVPAPNVEPPNVLPPSVLLPVPNVGAALPKGATVPVPNALPVPNVDVPKPPAPKPGRFFNLIIHCRQTSFTAGV